MISSVCFIPSEAAKLQSHLKLLRQEYVKLQKNHAELEKKYQVVAAANGENMEENFVSRLLKIIADLFDKDLYRFVLMLFIDKLLELFFLTLII